MASTDQFTDQQILAKTIWGENRGGGEDGMTSVANVIINRASKPGWWGSSIRSVCLKFDQFDCWLPNDPNYPLILAVDESNPSYAMALDIAAQAITGSLPDITNGAQYYFASSMPKPPLWAVGLTPCAEIAGQKFFNNVTTG